MTTKKQTVALRTALAACEEQNKMLVEANLQQSNRIDTLEEELECAVDDLDYAQKEAYDLSRELAENTANSYQNRAMRTYTPRPNLDGRDAMLLGALGLAGEVGEVVELVKKHVFHNKPLDMDKLVLELGDVLWYLAVMARTVPNVSLGTIAQKNIAKLEARYPQGADFGLGIK